MSTKSVHQSEEMTGWYTSRSLEYDFPEVIPFLSPELNVLDVGCGPGTITLDLASRVPSGSVTAVDNEASLLQRGSELAKEKHVRNVKFVEADAMHLPFSDGVFDLSYSRDVLHHTPNPIGILKEQRRVVRPGGVVISVVPDWGTFVAFPEMKAVQRVMQKWRCFSDKKYNTAFVDNFVGRKIFHHYKEAGFQNVRVRGICQNEFRVAADTQALKKMVS